MKKIRIALIGLNKLSHAQPIVSSIKTQSDIFELAGYTLPENEREKFPEIAAQLDGFKEMPLEEILNDSTIEAVAVETEEIYLTKYATLAAEHGKHIHMEKPGGISLRGFEKLIETVKKSGKVFHTGYMYRYNPYVKELIQKIKNGELGEIISVEAQMNCYHTAVNRQWLEAFPGGIMFFLGCHLVDLILQIKGKPERIIPLHRCTGLDGVTAQDFGMTVFVYKNGISIAKVNAAEVGGFARRQLVVSGSKQTVELKPLEMYTSGGLYTGMTEYHSEDWKDMGTAKDSNVYNRYDSMMAAFAAMVRGECENPYTYDYELELYKTILMACEEGKK